MDKRTIKPAAGKSRVSAAAAISAAHYVYRDTRTGRYIVSKDDLTKTGERKIVKRLPASLRRETTTASKKR